MSLEKIPTLVQCVYALGKASEVSIWNSEAALNLWGRLPDMPSVLALQEDNWIKEVSWASSGIAHNLPRG